MHERNQLLFSVRSLDGQYFFEDINGIFKHTVPVTELQNVFPPNAGNAIIKLCDSALSGESIDDFTTADLGFGSLYSLSVVYHEDSTCFFKAQPLAHKRNQSKSQFSPVNQIKSGSAFTEMFDNALHGVCIWQAISNNRYLLTYVNDEYCHMTGLSKNALGKTLEGAHSVKQADMIREHIDSCIKTQKPLEYTLQNANGIFKTHLYPCFEDKRLTRVMEISLNITQYEKDHQQLLHAYKQLSQCDNMLRRQLKFEELISKTTRAFMEAGDSGFDACVETFIKALSDLLHSDLSFVVKNDTLYSDGYKKWTTDNSTAFRSLRDIERMDGYGLLMQQLRNGRLFVINDFSEYDSQSFAQFISAARAIGICSALAVPILRDNDFWGIIGLLQLKEKRIWSTLDVSMVKEAAETIMSAYIRIRTERQLNESNQILVAYDECLQDMLAVQETLAKVAQSYIVSGVSGFDTCSDSMLKQICELLELDGACLIVKDPYTKQASMYQWNKMGIWSWEGNRLNVQEMMSAWIQLLSEKDCFMANSTTGELLSLPPAIADQTSRLGLKSFLALPIRQQNKDLGMMVLGKVLSCHSWTNTHIHTLKSFVEVFLGAYLRKANEHQLMRVNQTHGILMMHAFKKTDVTSIIAKHAQEFIDATADTLLPSFSRLCKALSKPLHIASVRISRYYSDAPQAQVVFEWGELRERTDSKTDSRIRQISLVYQKYAWGRMSIRFYHGHNATESAHILELAAQYFIRAYMRIHSHTHAFSRELPESEAPSLTLIPNLPVAEATAILAAAESRVL